RRRSGHRHRFRKRPSFLRVGSVRRTHLFDVLPHPEKPLGKKLLEGDPVIVIRDGKILENNLRKSRFNVDQILQLLREKDVFDVSQVQFAILENDGSLSVMRKPEHQQLTPKSLSQPPKKSSPGADGIGGRRADHLRKPAENGENRPVVDGGAEKAASDVAAGRVLRFSGKRRHPVCGQAPGLLTNTVRGRKECNFPGRSNLTPEKEGTRQWLS